MAVRHVHPFDPLEVNSIDFEHRAPQDMIAPAIMINASSRFDCVGQPALLACPRQVEPHDVAVW